MAIKKYLNYKNWHDVHCDEYEVEIDDVENLNLDNIDKRGYPYYLIDQKK